MPAFAGNINGSLHLPEPSPIQIGFVWYSLFSARVPYPPGAPAFRSPLQLGIVHLNKEST